MRLWRRFVVANEWPSNLKKICPTCHLDLPHSTATGQLDGDIIAIIVLLCDFDIAGSCGSG
jgi:hypothetical protein